MLGLALGVILSIISQIDDATQAPLIPGATELEEVGRYNSSKSYDKTIKFYRRWVNNNAITAQWRPIINLPRIKAIHIKNTQQNSKWQGINIYELQGKVRIFIIPQLQASKNE